MTKLEMLKTLPTPKQKQDLGQQVEKLQVEISEKLPNLIETMSILTHQNEQQTLVMAEILRTMDEQAATIKSLAKELAEHRSAMTSAPSWQLDLMKLVGRIEKTLPLSPTGNPMTLASSTQLESLQEDLAERGLLKKMLGKLGGN